MNRKTFLYSYIHTRMIGVLSTVNVQGNTESAVMEFGDTPELELIFDTLCTTRKYRNLQKNPVISFVIGWENGSTVQYEGIATELHGKNLAKYKQFMFQKNASFQRWEGLVGMRYFKVIPTWIRYSAMDETPWELMFP